VPIYLVSRKWADYDETRAAVVRANDPAAARALARSTSQDEGPDAWLLPSTTVELISPDGEPDVILTDVREG
jgi:hypothetical protein